MSDEKSGSIFAVGKPFPFPIPNTEGAHYACQDGSHFLTIFMRRPTKEEIESVEAGEMRLALGVERGVICLYFTFTKYQCEAMFSIHLVEPAESRVLPVLDIPDGKGAILTVFLVDPGDGVLKGMRAVGMNNDFTYKLHKAIHEQAAAPFDSAAHFETCRRITAAYTTKELINRAYARMRVGEKTWPEEI